MKIVIIGGGIAGYTAAIALKQNNHEVVIKEKNALMSSPGMAFMLHGETIKTIQNLVGSKLELDAYKIDSYSPHGLSDNQALIRLQEWFVVKRLNLQKSLKSRLGDTEIHENKEFSHFIFENARASAAVFSDGSIESADFFIGADGTHSSVRNFVCEADFYPREINEMVCILENQDVSDPIFKKFYALEEGAAFGTMPISESEIIWFLQFNYKKYGTYFQRRPDIEKNINLLKEKLPSGAQKLIQKSDLKKAHLWNSRESKLLPSYHKNNICLIGDAAHCSISLTSSGVSFAISSALSLSKALNSDQPINTALDKYEEELKNGSQLVIEYAQKLKNQFLNPTHNEENLLLPLYKNR